MIGVFFRAYYFCLQPFKRQRKKKTSSQRITVVCLLLQFLHLIISISIPLYTNEFFQLFHILIFSHTCTVLTPSFPLFLHRFVHSDSKITVFPLCNSFMIYRIEFEHSHRRRGPNEINHLSRHCHPTIGYFASENKKKCF